MCFTQSVSCRRQAERRARDAYRVSRSPGKGYLFHSCWGLRSYRSSIAPLHHLLSGADQHDLKPITWSGSGASADTTCVVASLKTINE